MRLSRARGRIHFRGRVAGALLEALEGRILLSTFSKLPAMRRSSQSYSGYHFSQVPFARPPVPAPILAGISSAKTSNTGTDGNSPMAGDAPPAVVGLPYVAVPYAARGQPTSYVVVPMYPVF